MTGVHPNGSRRLRTGIHSGYQPHDVTESATDVLDIWPYVGSVPSTDLEHHVIHDRFVEYVYRTDGDRYDHVLVMTKTKNVYLAVVVDLAHNSIYGHRLLDLNREYGLT